MKNLITPMHLLWAILGGMLWGPHGAILLPLGILLLGLLLTGLNTVINQKNEK